MNGLVKESRGTLGLQVKYVMHTLEDEVFAHFPGLCEELLSTTKTERSAIDALVFGSTRQDNFLKDLNHFNRAITACGLEIRQPYAYACHPFEVIQQGLQHALFEFLHEDRKCMLLFLQGAEHLCGVLLSRELERQTSDAQELADTLSALGEELANSQEFHGHCALAKPGKSLLEIRPTFQSIGLALGSEIEIEFLDESILPADAKNLLPMLGVKAFRKSEEGHLSLLLKAIGRTLKGWKGNPEKIQKILLTSHTFHQFDEALPQLEEALDELGIQAPVELLYMTRCASFLSCLRHGHHQLSCSPEDPVLIAMVDLVTDEQNGRTLNNNLSLFSDGAAACILSDGGTGFEVAELREFTQNKMATVHPESNFVDYLKQFSEGLKRSVGPLQKDDFEHVIIGNYNLSIMKNYCLLMGLQTDRVERSRLEANAHVFSADILINLQAALDAGHFDENCRIAALGTGSFHWGFANLVYHT